MKRILKSIFSIGALAAIMSVGTGAYFNSTAVAQDNEINTGTLLLAVDTAQNETDNRVWNVDAWNVVRENADGTVTVGNPFITWTNAAPGEENAYYVGLRNRGTIDMNVRATATGEWVDGPRFGQVINGGPNGILGDGDDAVACPAVEDADESLVQVTNVHQFASENCEGEIGCHNLYYSLTGLGWDHLDGLGSHDASPDPDDGYYYGTVGGGGQAEGTHYLLGENEFAVYRVDVTLNGPDTNNCYQDATYEFDFQAEGKQEADPAW
ncbi:MAG TPA: SipW-dependent-type signal peptide-containing protein [Patescibacteria group bacterium]